MKKSLFSLSLVISTIFLTSTLYAQFTTFTQPNGNIQFGPNTNSGYTEIYTSQSKFLFNKDIYTLGTFGLSSYSTNNLFLKTNGTTRMTINNSNGYIGIGTTTPSEMLHVNGNILSIGDFKTLDNKALILGDPYSATGSMRLSHASNGNTYCDLNGSLFFRKMNVLNEVGTTLGIQNDGTVTIGVWGSYNNTVANTSGNKLMVNGGILCESVKVIGDVPNSDHVFEKSYTLRSIEEVKEYVWKNKHLPEIPSAQEFKENGYSVGQMDDVLLRKVEELTLYVIQLNEENQALKARVQALEK